MLLRLICLSNNLVKLILLPFVLSSELSTYFDGDL